MLAAPAAAFCRTTTCGPGECVPAPECAYCLEGGLPLYWPGGCTSFSTALAGSPLRQITAGTTGQIVSDSLAQWIGVDCGGGATPSLAIFRTGDVTCDAQEYNQDSPNANIWMYRDDQWPYAGSGSTLALTTVTFNVKTGAIYDADVEINSIDSELTVGDGNVQADLISIVTHESGHFLGLSHSCDNNATMFASYKYGDIGLRSLEADDVAGICAIYPPGTDTSQCDPTPRHGFSGECGAPLEDKGCCTTAPGRPSGRGALAVALCCWAVGAGVYRRRRRRAG
ncbi:MAG: matrixin family metalloprotease [Myxococcales bacterium]|nr:matrixin family metalloprotease [Myxococcales bacterium]